MQGNERKKAKSNSDQGRASNKQESLPSIPTVLEFEAIDAIMTTTRWRDGEIAYRGGKREVAMVRRYIHAKAKRGQGEFLVYLLSGRRVAGV